MTDTRTEDLMVGRRRDLVSRLDVEITVTEENLNFAIDNENWDDSVIHGSVLKRLREQRQFVYACHEHELPT